jgi:hypothetical protein
MRHGVSADKQTLASEIFCKIAITHVIISGNTRRRSLGTKTEY